MVCLISTAAAAIYYYFLLLFNLPIFGNLSRLGRFPEAKGLPKKNLCELLV